MTERDDSHSLFDFTELAADYERWYETPAGRAHDEVQQADARRLLPRAAPGARLLDVGCGTGHWSRVFATLGYEVVGVDLCQEMLRLARARGMPGCRFAVADALALPFGDARFDVVATMATLEFVSDAARALKEMFRCVAPHGRMLVGTLNRLAPLNARRLADGRKPYALAHLVSPGELRELLAPFGRVHMLASVPIVPPAHGRERAAESVATLDGPFIVAEVHS